MRVSDSYFVSVFFRFGTTIQLRHKEHRAEKLNFLTNLMKNGFGASAII